MHHAFRKIHTTLQMGCALGFVAQESSRRLLITYGLVKPEIIYVTDSMDWSLFWDGHQIANGLPGDYKMQIVSHLRDYRYRVVHFGSRAIYLLGRAFTKIHASNRQVLTWFHGQLWDDNPGIQAAIRALPEGSQYANKIVTACRISENNLLAWGIEPTKIVRIPLGVDTRWFAPPPATDRDHIRAELGIPQSAMCIGSFQKDGVGWSEGNEPKMIKGPDIFLQVVARLAERYPLFVLLTGPARGYVRRGLENLGIPYCHNYLTNYLDIVRYYQALDLYLITSRDEGGPKALLEAMATGVPLVATSVGMCPDVIKNGENGFLVDVGDVEGMVQTAQQVLDHPQTRINISDAALRDVRSYDWSQIARQYDQFVYRPLINEIVYRIKS